MAGLVPAIHAVPTARASNGLARHGSVDARDKPGHDGGPRPHPAWRAGRSTGRSRIGRLMAAEAKDSATESHQTMS